MNIIEVDHLGFAYNQAEVLRGLSFKVSRRGFLAIIGPNGAGKTTLLHLLCGSLRLTGGSIRLDAEPIESYGTEALARKVAVVRQQFVPVFGFTVMETVMMARTAYFSASGFDSEADRQIVSEAMEMTDTNRFASRRLGQLSGGERQRVFIARALAQDTEVLLLDEPTSFLDMKHQVGIYDLLKRMQTKENKTVVTVTHDINLAAQYADAALLLGSDGRYHIGTTREVLRPKQIARLFGVRTFSGTVGTERFFLPMGDLAKDRDRAAAENDEG